MLIKQANLTKRRDRSQFIADYFAGSLKGSILDVGCFEAPLRDILLGEKYFGIDIVGRPDQIVDLDAVASLPFEDGEFDCVLCIEVLEHLDNLHRIFDELIRVGRHDIIVSLPNAWRDARRPIERGKGSFAHYGLPLEKPLDRHKWFFNFTQARDFLLAKSQQHNLNVVDVFATEQPRHPILRTVRHIRYPGEKYLNRYAQTVWIHMRKS